MTPEFQHRYLIKEDGLIVEFKVIEITEKCVKIQYENHNTCWFTLIDFAKFHFIEDLGTF